MTLHSKLSVLSITPGPVPAVMILSSMRRTAKRGVMHRDLKPANIMQKHGREPIIMDFGLARSYAGSDRLTTTGTPLGTPAYMSPEQFGGSGQSMGPGCDVYSLGVILYELLTGE